MLGISLLLFFIIFFAYLLHIFTLCYSSFYKYFVCRLYAINKKKSKSAYSYTNSLFLTNFIRNVVIDLKTNVNKQTILLPIIKVRMHNYTLTFE